MINAIKEWFLPTIQDIPQVKYSCKKHGEVETTIGMSINGVVNYACWQCITESFPVERIEQ